MTEMTDWGREIEWGREIKNADELRKLVIGQTITDIGRVPGSGEWLPADSTVTITLSDGMQVRFAGYSYDDVVLITEYRKAPSSEA